MKTDQLRGQTLAASLSGRFWNQGEAEVWTIRRLSLSVKLVSDGDAPMETWRFDIHCFSNNNGRGKKRLCPKKVGGATARRSGGCAEDQGDVLL